MIDVAVIGGGISGLTAAIELKQQGYDVKVLERQVCSGGNAISENINGFLMEHGPSTINAAMSEVHNLSKAVDLESSTVRLSDDVKHRYLVKKGELKGISTHPLGFLTSDYLSLKGRLRLMAEAIVPRGDNETGESIDQYIARRFGDEFSKRIMDPLVGGLYAGNADELAVKSVFPKLIEMEQTYGSVSIAALVRRLRGHVMPARRLYSWSNGVGSLPTALSVALSGNIHTGVSVRKVRARSQGFEVETAGQGKITAQAVLIATQPHVASTLLENVAPVGAEALGEISAPPLAVVFLGYKRAAVEHSLDGLGYLSASSENQILTGAQFPSSMFSRRAPEGYISLTGYLGGVRSPEIGQMQGKDLIGLAQDEFRDLLGVRGNCELSRVRCWSRGLPQYDLGHPARTSRIQNIPSENPDVFVVGNYLIGPSVGACVANARKVAESASSYLRLMRSAKSEGSSALPKNSRKYLQYR